MKLVYVAIVLGVVAILVAMSKRAKQSPNKYDIRRESSD
jgi:hypothetical protein